LSVHKKAGTKLVDSHVIEKKVLILKAD